MLPRAWPIRPLHPGSGPLAGLLRGSGRAGERHPRSQETAHGGEPLRCGIIGISSLFVPRSVTMNTQLPFAEVLEAVDQLSAEEQETLVATVHRRIAERGRKRLAAEVQEAR